MPHRCGWLSVIAASVEPLAWQFLAVVLFMNIIKISKGNGKFRTIYVPSPEEKQESMWWVSRMAERAARLDTHGVQHGFTDGRNCVTNAMRHIGFRYTLSFDLKDFFDSVTPDHLTTVNPKPSACFVDGAARQGLPSSPPIANLAAVGMDSDILALGRGARFGQLFTYTRYADDLTFSFNESGTAHMLMAEIPKIVERHKFAINPAKTCLQFAGAGRRIITGIAVGDTKVYVTRDVKRRLRAAAHQLRNGLRHRNRRHLIAAQKKRSRKDGSKPSLNSILVARARGLAEWAKLKLPKAVVRATPEAVAQTSPHVAILPDPSMPVMQGPKASIGVRKLC